MTLTVSTVDATWAMFADSGDHGERLDRVLVRRLRRVPEISRSRIQRWIRDGRVRVEGRGVVRASMHLIRGERVEVALPGPPTVVRRPPEPENRPLAVLFEDDHLLAVDKPAGMLVHPTPGCTRGTLLNALLAHARGWPGDRRPRLVQRLDRGTSGVLLVAKRREIHAALQRELAAPTACKEYLAVVYGVPEGTKGRIDLRLRAHPEDPRKRVANRSEGLTAATRYEVLATTPGPGQRLSLLACRLETGRTHQIRAHLAASGWALVGDPLYGETPEPGTRARPPRWPRLNDPNLARLCERFERQALHARRVVCRHPVEHTPLRIEAPLPADLRELLAVGKLESPLTGSTSDRYG